MDKLTRFSQNFLRDPQLVQTLLAKTNIKPTDTVYDIGGGKGIITSVLAEKCRTVISIEIDPHLVRSLRERIRAYSNVIVYKTDFLQLPLPQTPYKIFANIPFNLSADILRKLTTADCPPSTSYIIVQREFAYKLIPEPGNSSQLSILLGVQFAIQIVCNVQPADFYPRPKVAAMLIELKFRAAPLITPKDVQLFRDFVIYVYNAHQPTIVAALPLLFSPTEFSRIAGELKFSLTATPTQLDLRQWVGLFKAALQKRSALKTLVNGHERLLDQKHSKRTKIHRTRPNR